MAGYIPAFWLSRYKTAVLTLRLSSEERDMSDAPERIWHTTDRKGKIYGATDAHVEPCKSVARHYVEYIRADLVHADAELSKLHHAQAFGAGVDLSPQWQPIGTAPKKDYGVDVLLRAPDGMVVAWFDTDEQEWISDYRGKGNSQYIHAPTHWMPLPKPPT